VCVLELGANLPNYIFLVKCGKTTSEAFWAINEPHDNEEKEEEKKANGSVHSKRGKIREEE
jgi:hypothetical protein